MILAHRNKILFIDKMKRPIQTYYKSYIDYYSEDVHSELITQNLPNYLSLTKLEIAKGNRNKNTYKGSRLSHRTPLKGLKLMALLAVFAVEFEADGDLLK